MKRSWTYHSYIMWIGPHPDDVEIWAWGVIAKSSKQGKKNIILDLTPSQLSTHWDIDTRLRESQQAAHVLWVAHRHNLMLEDGKLCDNCVAREEIAHQIRLHKPEIVLIPWKLDRHPDHECTSSLVKNAVFCAGLSKIDLDGLPPHKPRMLLYYMIRQAFDPDLIIPLTDAEYQTKMNAFTCYQSQIQTNSRWEELVHARHVMHGHEIWVRYGEWFKLYSHGIGIDSFDHIKNGFF